MTLCAYSNIGIIAFILRLNISNWTICLDCFGPYSEDIMRSSHISFHLMGFLRANVCRVIPPTAEPQHYCQLWSRLWEHIEESTQYSRAYLHSSHKYQVWKHGLRNLLGDCLLFSHCSCVIKYPKHSLSQWLLLLSSKLMGGMDALQAEKEAVLEVRSRGTISGAPTLVPRYRDLIFCAGSE